VLHPFGRADQAASEPGNIEAKLAGAPVDHLFLGGEKIEKQRGDSAGVKDAGDVEVSGAVTAAAAAVSEEDNTEGARRNAQGAGKGCITGMDDDFARFGFRREVLFGSHGGSPFLAGIRLGQPFSATAEAGAHARASSPVTSWSDTGSKSR